VFARKKPPLSGEVDFAERRKTKGWKPTSTPAVIKNPFSSEEAKNGLILSSPAIFQQTLF